MSGKTPTALVSVRDFYGESPPKKSRVHETIITRPAFKNLKENLIEFDRQIAEPIKSSELKETDNRELGHEPKSLDRDSPIPLKNLGNTCYENSIIQCLFSLNMFMENFDRSMKEMRQYVVKPEVQSFDFKKNSNGMEEHQQQEQLEEAQQDVAKDAPRITESDVRYRIADAFDKLYKSYTQKRIQIETNNQSSNTNSTAPNTAHLDDDNLAPIALVSSTTTTTNEQSEIETRLEDLKSAVGEISSQFNSTHQQDASEFFYHVIDSIQEFYQGLNKTKDDDNPVTRAFELELDYLIRCPKCHHKNLSEPERIRTLPLALPHANNEISANQENEESNHTTNGTLTPPSSDLGLDSPDSSPKADQRNSSDEKENRASTEDEVDEISIPTTTEDNSNNTESIAKLDLTDNPNQNKASSPNNHPDEEPKRISTLCDALNNYFKDDLLEYSCSQPGCDSKQRTRKCLIRKLPQVLFITLARYSYAGKKNLDEIEAPFELSVPLRENKSPSHSPLAHCQLNDDDNTYQLVAVVCHLGSSLNAGHYTSYVYNQNNLSWYSCDDDSITKVKETHVKNDATKSGYCFFYAHKSCVGQHLKQQRPQQEAQERHPTPPTDKNITMPSKQGSSVFYSDDVAASSIILTPESSPTSYVMSQESDQHENHNYCENGTTTIDDDIDDWS